jgi:hypothetical protein
MERRTYKKTGYRRHLAFFASVPSEFLVYRSLPIKIREWRMRFILSVMSVFCALSIVSLGCRSDEKKAEKKSGDAGVSSEDAGVSSEDDAIEGTGGTGGTGRGANENPTESTGGTSATGGTGATSGTGGNGNEEGATDEGAEKDDETVDSGVETVDNCDRLSACCDTLREPSRTDCRSIVRLGVDEGCEAFIPTYCNAVDEEATGDDRPGTSCEELSICCARQTNTMFEDICNSAVSANSEMVCSALLGAELPGGVPCDSTDSGAVDNVDNNDGVVASCDDLSVCCAKQTNTMFEDICNAGVSMNNEATCSFLLTLDLPGGVPCD